MSIMANELKKGTRVLLDNGWEAVLVDDPSGENIRQARVYGACTETGSIYVDKIVKALIDGEWVGVSLDDDQREFSELKKQFGF
jgi:hypothetical protein